MSQVVGQKLYLDTNIFIYALEEIDPWGEVTKKILGAIDAGDCLAATSELTLAECLVKPLELGRTEIAQMYLDFLQNRRSLEVVPVSRPILTEAARLRAVSRLRLPDAIHAATAVRQGCTRLVTNDQRFHAVPGIQALLLKDLQ